MTNIVFLQKILRFDLINLEKMNELIHIKTISDVHKVVYIEKPKHPLVSVFYHSNKRLRVKYQGNRFVSDLYVHFLENK